jgi:glucuronokinase
MELIRRRAFARAGLIGNPSDGYQGKTLSISVRDFWADVVLYEWDQIELVLSQEDRSRFRNIQELARDVQLHGYYGGVRLVKATIKKFVDYCTARDIGLHDRNFSVRYESNIPRQVGLAGSSAIIVATLRCLMDFYQVEIPQRVQPSLALSVEAEELGIGAGLQDRVIQVYEGLVAMDFSDEVSEQVDGYTCGRYEPLPCELLPPLYIAYRADQSGPTELVHNDLRARHHRGEPAVLDAMRRLMDVTDNARAALLAGDHALLGRLIDENFDIRRSICQLPTGQAEMVDRARQVGATAKFSGSGGAIIGTYADAAMFERLSNELSPLGCPVIRPQIVASD